MEALFTLIPGRDVLCIRGDGNASILPVLTIFPLSK
jgi:hypothetical protein